MNVIKRLFFLLVLASSFQSLSGQTPRAKLDSFINEKKIKPN